MDLLFNVQNQTITRIDSNPVVADSRNYLHASFTFSSDWADIDKVAVFWVDLETPYNIAIEDGKCLVPWEVLNTGVFYISVYGGNLITANVCKVKVDKSGYYEGGSGEEPTPTIYDRINRVIDKLAGGDTNTVLQKISDDDFDFEWIDNPAYHIRYEDIEGTPTEVSEFNNDAGYLVEQDLAPYAKKTEVPGLVHIPSNVSEFDNDAGYITESDIPKKVSAFENDKAYLTQTVASNTFMAKSNPTGIGRFTIGENNNNFVRTNGAIVGTNNTLNAEASNSAIFGTNNQTSEPNQLIAGKFNTSRTDALFIVGNGTSIYDRKNVFEVRTSGAYVNNKAVATTDQIGEFMTQDEADERYTQPTSFKTINGNNIVGTGDIHIGGGGGDVPTKLSELENDVGFITDDDVPTKVSDLTNDSGFITTSDVEDADISYDIVKEQYGDYETITENIVDAIAAKRYYGEITPGSGHYTALGTTTDPDNIASGYGSFASGSFSVASGNASVSVGDKTVASQNGAFAEGMETVASAENAHAEGIMTEAKHTASHVGGAYTKSSAPYQLVTGYYNADNANARLIIGDGSAVNRRNLFEVTTNAGVLYNGSRLATASANESLSGGEAKLTEITVNGTKYNANPKDGEVTYQTIKQRYGSEYNNVTKTIDEAIAVHRTYNQWGDECGIITNKNNVASAWYTTAEGLNTEANAEGAHAEGEATLASGVCSHAEGSTNTASGASSHAEGYSTTASGSQSHSEGIITTASGTGSHSGGTNSSAIGDYSFAHGFGCQANNSCSVAIGDSLSTSMSGQAVFGAYNSNNSNAYLIVGCGTSSSRANALEVTASGTYANGNKVLTQLPIDSSAYGSTITLSKDSIRYITNVSNVTINLPTSIVPGQEYNLVFTTGSSVDISWDSRIKWAGGEAPELESGKRYEVSVDGWGVGLCSRGADVV